MNITFKKSNDDIEKHSGMLLIDKALSRCDLSKFDHLSNKTQNKRWIPNSSVVKSAIFLQCFAMPDFQDIKELSEDSLFTTLIGSSISPETYRQRMDFLAKEDNISALVDSLIVQVLKNRPFLTTRYNNKDFYTLDIDVTPFCNPNVKKEGVSCTYKKVDGYAPIMAYFCQYALCFDLREGSQHSEKGAVEFLNRVLDMVRALGIPMEDVLVRVDSGHDDAKFTDACIENKVKFIVKRNHRGVSHAEIIADMRANVAPITSRHGNHSILFQCYDNMEPTNAKKHGLFAAFKLVEEDPTKAPLLALLSDRDRPCELSSYWTNLNIVEPQDKQFGFLTAKACDQLYREHATSEQYHSELKGDMHMELLPSKYFATNSLFLHIAALSFNVLRIIGHHAVNNDKRFQHHKKDPITRIRLRTVIDKICTIAFKLVFHARRMFIKFGRKAFFYKTFVKIYQSVG